MRGVEGQQDARHRIRCLCVLCGGYFPTSKSAQHHVAKQHKIYGKQNIMRAIKQLDTKNFQESLP